MVEISRPWTGISTGDAGPYSSEQWADIWKTLGVGGAKADSGPLIGSGTSPDIGLTVQANSPAAANVVVTPGSALVEGTWYQNTANNTLTIAANGSGNPRIDTVVLRKDYSAQTVRLAVKQGTPAVTPAPPGLTQTDGTLWEIPLADIAVANGFVSIAAADITPRRHFANAADGVYLLDVLNNSGVTLETGDVVIWDSTANRAVTTTTALANRNVAGAWVGRTANGAYGRVLRHGIGYVKMSGAVASRNLPVVSTTSAKNATTITVGNTQSLFNAFGVTLETTSGAGLCLCYLDASAHPLPAMADLVRVGVADYTTNAGAFGDVDGANLILTLTVYSGRLIAEASFTASVDNTAGSDGEFDLILDSTTRAGHATDGLMRVATNQAQRTITLIGTWTGISAGSHTVKPQYRSTLGGTTTIFNNGFPIVMRAREI